MPDDPDGIDPDRLRTWLAVATDRDGHEHVVLSDGWRHIRLDIEDGSLVAPGPVRLHYRLSGLASVEAKILPLRRFLDLCHRGRFGRTLFPADPRVERWLVVLRVADALAAGASQREIGTALFGEQRIASEWNGSTDSLRSRVRRLAREARAMAGGGYRRLMLRFGRG